MLHWRLNPCVRGGHLTRGLGGTLQLGLMLKAGYLACPCKSMISRDQPRRSFRSICRKALPSRQGALSTNCGGLITHSVAQPTGVGFEEALPAQTKSLNTNCHTTTQGRAPCLHVHVARTDGRGVLVSLRRVVLGRGALGHGAGHL